MSVLLRGGIVVDGTGTPRHEADVLLEGDRIAAVGPGLDATGASTIDVDGLVVSPGFIDIHTHYDAQILWDPDLTPSSYHGVTTVVMGNCGFGIAPTRVDDRDTVIRTLENVEGMAADALREGIEWTFESFPEYLDALDARELRLNVGAMIGHSPLRLFVLGSDIEGPATEAQVAEMRTLVEEAVAAGALGFATSRSPNHQGAGGRPVPSFFATDDEIFAIAGALKDVGTGVVQVTPGSGFGTRELAELALRTERPVTWTALLAGAGGRGKTKEILDRTAALGGEVWPQTACRPVVMQVTMADPYPFATAAPFKEVLAVPTDRRADRYSDPDWRDAARREIDQFWGDRWHLVSVDESETRQDLVGASVLDLAGSWGVHPLDVLVDLSLADGLGTRFRVVVANDDETELEALLLDPRAVLGLSDAGAHASQLCDACFSTHLLGHWVRERGVLDLEFAVWRLTAHAAQVLRIPRRGRLVPGYAADIVVFDADRVGVGPMERVRDLPAGADRLVNHGMGIEHVFVNGGHVVRSGEQQPVRPGRLIRGGSA